MRIQKERRCHFKRSEESQKRYFATLSMTRTICHSERTKRSEESHFF
ncbi:MAG: hypothetical protein JXA68_08480 [Ignavibacteriales bacterium]|nr:hypothetical protein [Ignavibacteriales bacterium]